MLFSCHPSEHECGFPGCRNVLVIDGNMKNRRDICAASEAGFTEYEGLPIARNLNSAAVTISVAYGVMSKTRKFTLYRICNYP